MTDPATARALRTVALIKQVPRGGRAQLGLDGRLGRVDASAEINPWCRRALAYAIRLARDTGGTSTTMTMGPPRAADALREAIACGTDTAVHLCDPALSGADCLVTSRALAAAIRHYGVPDLLLVGRSTIDSATTATGPMIAEELGLPFVGPALTLEISARGDDLVAVATLQRGHRIDTAEVSLPAVVALAERSIQPAKADPDTWPADRLGVHTVRAADVPGCPAGADSPTTVIGVRRAPAGERQPVILYGSGRRTARAAADLIRDRLRHMVAPVGIPVPRSRGVAGPAVLTIVEDPRSGGAARLLATAARVAAAIDGHVVALSTDPAVRDCARFGADATLVLPAPAAAIADAATAIAAHIAQRGMPWAVLGAASPDTQELLARLGARLGAGLLADLVTVDVQCRHDDLRLVGTKPAGERCLADLAARGPTQIATVRTGCLPPAEPRDAPPALDLGELTHQARRIRVVRSAVADVDADALDQAACVIGVGQGVLPQDYPALDGLRLVLSAELAATRKVTDRGWLPHARQLGITARDIAPNLYLAIGISGNDNHLAGVARAGTIVALNHDPAAPVFARCDIGIVAEWSQLVPLLEHELAGTLIAG